MRFARGVRLVRLGRRRSGLLSHGAAEEYRAQEKNTLHSSSFASLVLPEVFCPGSPHDNGAESNFGTTARQLVGCRRENFSMEVQGVPRSANAANTSVRATRSARTFACRAPLLATHGGSKDSLADSPLVAPDFLTL